MGRGGSGPELLANETLMKEGQVIRSTTNQVYIHYRSLRQSNHGTFSLHYQGKWPLLFWKAFFSWKQTHTVETINSLVIFLYLFKNLCLIYSFCSFGWIILGIIVLFSYL